MKTEVIKIVVEVKINYTTEQERKECIKRALENVTSKSILSRNSIIPKRAKILKTNN